MNIKKSICLSLICIITIGFIFFNSSQSSFESNVRSYKIAERVLAVAEKHQQLNYIIHGITVNLARIEKLDTTGFIDTVGIFNLLIRKCAHAFEFFLLAMIFCLTFTTINIKGRDIIIYSLFVVICSAVCDEFLQLFIMGRTSSIVDVVIDSAGGICACIVFLSVKFIYASRRHKLRNIKQ